MSWKRSILSKDDELLVNQKITEFEKNTGVELLIALSKSSDPYPAAGLRFCIGLFILFSFISVFLFTVSELWIFLVFQLGLLLLGALLGRIPIFRRAMLTGLEIEREVKEKATEIYYLHGRASLDQGPCALIYLSFWEKQLQILVGQTLSKQLHKKELKNISGKISHHFADKNYFIGLCESIDNLETAIKEKFSTPFPIVNGKRLEDECLWFDFS